MQNTRISFYYISSSLHSARPYNIDINLESSFYLFVKNEQSWHNTSKTVKKAFYTKRERVMTIELDLFFVLLSRLV